MVTGYSFLSPEGMKRLTEGRKRLFFWGKESSIPGLFRVISGVLQNKYLNSSEEI